MQILLRMVLKLKVVKDLAIPGNKNFNKQNIKNFRLPHIGWNTVSTNDHNSKLSKNLVTQLTFIFLIAIGVNYQLIYKVLKVSHCIAK